MAQKSTTRIVNKTKLLKACAKAGIKTQRELAGKVADLYPDSSVSHTIGRMFRGEPVGLKVITMVLTALDIKYEDLIDEEIEVAYTDEQKSGDTKNTLGNIGTTSDLPNNKNVPDNTDNSKTKPLNRNKKRYLAVLGICIAVILALLWFVPPPTTIQYDISQSKLSVNVNNPTIAVVGLEESGLDKTFVGLLQTKLGEQFNVTETRAGKVVANLNEPFALIQKLNVDIVLMLTSKKKKRHKAIFIHAYDRQQKILIYADVINTPVVSPISDEIAEKSAHVLNSRIDPLQKNIELESSVDSATALLESLSFNDKPLTIYNLTHNINGLYRALSISPNYQEVQGLLCYTLTVAGYYESNPTKQKEAQQYCESITKNGNNSHNIKAAMAHKARKDGDYETAIAIGKELLASSQQKIDAYLRLAEIYLSTFTQTRNASLITQALELTTKAEELNSNYWKPSFIEGRIYYMSGKPELAIEATEKSANITPNFSNLSNLATINFCFGDIRKTYEGYKKISQLNGAEAVAFYNLASIQSYLEEYENSIRSINNYLDKLTQTNSKLSSEGAIGTADIYRAAGDIQKAKEFYEQAFTLAEKVRIQTPDNVANNTDILYISIALDTLQDSIMTESRLNQYKKELEDMALEANTPKMVMRLIFANMLIDRLASAKVLYNKIAPICKGYSEAPNFSRLKDDKA